MARSKRLGIILTDLEKQGARVSVKKSGYMVFFPDGSSLMIHTTESDHRAEKNTRSRVLKAGLTWVFDRG